jgi:hypothetical protein
MLHFGLKLKVNCVEPADSSGGVSRRNVQRKDLGDTLTIASPDVTGAWS